MRKITIFMVATIAFLLLVSSCDLIPNDYDGPIIAYSVSGQTLSFSATDPESGVSFVALFIDSNMVATYDSGFGSLSYDLSSLSYGSYNIKIEAEDNEGNLSNKSFVYNYEMYTEDVDINRTWISLFPPGIGEIKFEIVRKVTTYTPNGGAPPKPTLYEDYFFIRNYTPYNLYGWTSSVTAYDAGGRILWFWNSGGPTINIPYNGWFTGPTFRGVPVTPVRYVVTFF
jgi:hypothetical protein